MRRDVYQAIADPIRRGIIDLLADQALSVNDIAGEFDISRPAISKHLKILHECGIVHFNQVGRERMCIIQPQQLIPAFMWIKQYHKLWEDRIDNFENYVNHLQNENNKKNE